MAQLRIAYLPDTRHEGFMRVGAVRIFGRARGNEPTVRPVRARGNEPTFAPYARDGMNGRMRGTRATTEWTQRAVCEKY
jgi:hypothetical protein